MCWNDPEVEVGVSLFAARYVLLQASCSKDNGRALSMALQLRNRELVQSMGVDEEIEDG